MFIAAMILFMSLLKHSNGNRDHKTKRNEPTVISYIVLSTLILSAFLFRMDILKAILTLYDMLEIVLSVIFMNHIILNILQVTS